MQSLSAGGIANVQCGGERGVVCLVHSDSTGARMFGQEPIHRYQRMERNGGYCSSLVG
jgi:hypothetical protein